MSRRDELTKTLCDKAIKAIQSGNQRQAIQFVKELDDLFITIHDRYCEYCSSLETFIAKKYSEEALREALIYLINDVHKRTFIEPIKNGPHEKVVEMFAAAHRAHHSDFFVEEFEDRTVFTIRCCGSGGRMRRDGKYDNTDRHPMMGGTSKKAYPWAFNKIGVSYYCAHCGVLDELMKEWNLSFRMETIYGRQFDDEGKGIDEPCKYIIYK
jgi:hypothetical protein